MLQIYESLYRKDCLKARKMQADVDRAGLNKGKPLRGLPDKMQSFTKVIRPFLMNLHHRRVRVQPIYNKEDSRAVEGAPVPYTRERRELKDGELYYIENRLKGLTSHIHTEVFGPD